MALIYRLTCNSNSLGYQHVKKDNMDYALLFSEDGLTVIGCEKSYSGEIIIPEGVEQIAERVNPSKSRIVRNN